MFWDNAVRASSALRAALTRAFLDECHQQLGREVGLGLTDIQGFYDHIDLVIIFSEAGEWGYPRQH
eukprot:11081263-Lingulodinium_polyedra.AAC.1